MTSLASLSQLGVRLGQDLTGNPQAQAFLDDASARIRGYLHFDFVATTRTVCVDVCRGKATLPYGPVVSITSVKVAGDPVTYTWTTGTEISIPGGYLKADIVYVSGWSATPADIVAVACQMAGRAMGVPAGGSAGAPETLGAYSVGVSPVAIAGAVMLSIEDREILDGYKARPLKPIITETWVGDRHRDTSWE